jgi:hypothetical protein
MPVAWQRRRSRSEPAHKTFPPARTVRVLWKDGDLTLHAQLIVQSADVGIGAGMSEGDAEPRDAPSDACGSPISSCGAALMKPEFTLSAMVLIAAWRAPSASRVMFADGSLVLAGSTPKVMVCGVTGSVLISSRFERRKSEERG